VVKQLAGGDRSGGSSEAHGAHIDLTSVRRMMWPNWSG
jgi:hypothetical protein